MSTIMKFSTSPPHLIPDKKITRVYSPSWLALLVSYVFSERARSAVSLRLWHAVSITTSSDVLHLWVNIRNSVHINKTESNRAVNPLKHLRSFTLNINHLLNKLFNGNTLQLYSKGTQFESQSGYCLFWQVSEIFLSLVKQIPGLFQVSHNRIPIAICIH
jgi:hypothetical protein